MKRFVIERHIRRRAPGRPAAEEAATPRTRRWPGWPAAQWVQSYVVDNKTYCIYLADNEASVQEHARLSGFPADRVTEVRGVIDPMTAMA